MEKVFIVLKISIGMSQPLKTVRTSVAFCLRITESSGGRGGNNTQHEYVGCDVCIPAH